MGKSRLVAAIALTLVAALSAGIVVFLSGSGSVSAPVDYWTKRIKACEPQGMTDTGKVLDQSYDCLYDAIYDAVSTESFGNFAVAAEPIMARNIQFEYACHIPAHDNGIRYVEYYKGDYRKAILALGWDICGSGFVHGVYDIWGKESHSIEEWVSVVGDACLEANLVRFNACGDAIGHSAYESAGQDLAAAMNICDAQREDWLRIACANGAYMQANFPQSTKLKEERAPVLREPQQWSEFVSFCDRQSFANPGTIPGCYYGAGWVMGNTIFLQMQKMRSSGDEFFSTPKEDAEVLRLIEFAIDACMAGVHPEGDALGCSYIMLARMPLFFYGNIDKFEQFCRKATQGHEESLFHNCLTSGLEHVDPEPMAELVRRHPAMSDLMHLRNPVLAGRVGTALRQSGV